MLYYDKVTVGKQIKQSRKILKMTQCELAEKLDYTSERQLQRIENGETACSIDKLMEIAQILNVSTDFLLFGVEDTDIEVLGELFSDISEGQRVFLLKLLQAALENLKLLN